MRRATAAFAPRRCRDGVFAIAARSARTFARHSHDEFGIGLITEGAHRSWSGRGHVEAVRGNLITVNPGEVHDGAPLGQDRAWSMLYISPELVGSIAADASDGRVTAREFQAPVFTDPAFARRFALTWAADGHGEDFEAQLLLLCAAVLRFSSPPPPVHRLERVRERIDDDPAGPHALADLAALAGLSRFHMLRGFTRWIGMTPHGYVIQRRLDLARGRLRCGATLAEAAADAGFADQSHFHRAFVARYGLTPGAYTIASGHRGAIGR